MKKMSRLRVRDIKASNLPNVESKSSSDPYVTLAYQGKLYQVFHQLRSEWFAGVVITAEHSFSMNARAFGGRIVIGH